MNEQVIIIIATAVALLVLVVAALLLLTRAYRRLDEGTVLIIASPGGKRVVLERGALVFPLVHRAETMDISLKRVVIDFRGNVGLVCRDSIRADIRMSFYLRVRPTADDVLKVASTLGCARASDQQTLTDLFSAKFTEAMKSVGKQIDFEALCGERERFKDEVIDVIGHDLSGFVLEDAAVEHLEQTPIEALDPNNLFDAIAIRKITERTAEENVRANELRQRERREILAQNLAADEDIRQLELRRAEAEARHRQDITARRW